MAAKRRQTVAIDFDGVIHRYGKGWHDGTIYDEPVNGAIGSLARLHARYNIVIFTTRVNPDMRGSEIQMDRIIAWLGGHGFHQGEHYDEITHVKPPALAYIDDRALHFTAWDQALDEFRRRYRLP
jgi:hypothetical protein